MPGISLLLWKETFLAPSLPFATLQASPVTSGCFGDEFQQSGVCSSVQHCLLSSRSSVTSTGQAEVRTPTE